MVHAAEDDDAVTDDGVTLTHTVRGGDYSNLTEAQIDDLDVTVTITEDESRASRRIRRSWSSWRAAEPLTRFH